MGICQSSQNDSKKEPSRRNSDPAPKEHSIQIINRLSPRTKVDGKK